MGSVTERANGVTREPRVTPLVHGVHAEACDAIVEGLPYHFGNVDGLRACARAVREEDGLVALDGADAVGFLTFVRRFDVAAEITWMAVRADRRGGGVGTALVERFARIMAHEGRRLLLVLTLSTSEPEPDAPPGGGYAATRAFYASVGFAPVRDLPGLWPDDVAVLLVRALAEGDA